jgi:phage gpG-like protein
MPPRARGNPNLTPQQSVRRGLRMDEGIMQFDFQPSVGISARAIDRLGMDIRSFREPLKRAVQRVMAPSFQKNFDEEGRPDEWADLSDATLEIRERMGDRGDQILNRSGALRRVAGQLNIWTITQETATVRDLPERVWYGKLHQAGYEGSGGSSLWKSGGGKLADRVKRFDGNAKAAVQDLDDEITVALRGGRSGGGRQRVVPEIPARPFILIQEDDYDDVERVFVEWLQERAARNGFRPGVGLG